MLILNIQPNYLKNSSHSAVGCKSQYHVLRIEPGASGQGVGTITFVLGNPLSISQLDQCGLILINI